MDITDRKLLNLIQSPFPMVDQPFQKLGEEVGISEQEVLERLTELKRTNVLRQISAIFATRRPSARACSRSPSVTSPWAVAP